MKQPTSYREAKSRVKFLAQVLPQLQIPSKLNRSLVGLILQYVETNLQNLVIATKDIQRYNMDIYYRYFCITKPEYQGMHPLYVWFSEFPKGKPTISLFKVTRELGMLSKLKEIKKKTGWPECNLRKLKSDQVCRIYFSSKEWFVPSVTELRQICKAHQVPTQRANYKTMLTQLCSKLGRKPCYEDIPVQPKEIPFTLLRRACRAIKHLSGLPINLNSTKPQLNEFFLAHAQEYKTDPVVLLACKSINLC